MDKLTVLRILLGLAVFATVYFFFSWITEKRRIARLSYIERTNLQIREGRAGERRGSRNLLTARLARIGYQGDLAPLFVGVAFVYLLIAAVSIVVGVSSLVALLISLPGSIGATIGMLGYLERRRQSAATAQMLQVLRNVITYLEAGNPPQQAFYKAAALVGNPLRDDILSALSAQVGAVGMGVALAPLRDRYDSPATRLLVSALEINDIVGTKLVPTLKQAEDIIRRQLELSAEASAEISQAKAEFIGISAIIALIAFVLLVGAGEAARAAYTSPAGVTFIILGIGNYGLGVWRTLRVFRKAKRGLL
jgi:Flp pilus assembly protein TadB